MIIRSPSRVWLDQLTMAFLLVTLALVPPAVNGAPMYDSEQTETETYGEATGCYYNYNHYGEGDRIMTNEPCLNCTCHDRMLMCYLRVCPFTKAIGQDCTIEKREDQCCPVITCPEVEVQLLDHQTTASPSTALGGVGTSEVGALDQYGCSIGGRFYPEGAQVPSNSHKPCELCYCIRNMTTCVMQECTLHIDGCSPIYNKGVCCPVRYDCDHEKDTTPMLEDGITTTVRPTPGFILTTPASSAVSTDCVHNGETYADGALIMTEKPCEHCYCMRGDIVCAVQECGTPLENEGKNCVALPPAAGQCCPDKYVCDGGAAAATTTAAAPAAATMLPAMDAEKLDDDSQEAPQAATTLQPAVGTTPAADTVASGEKEQEGDDDDDDLQQHQQQEHSVPQFEDVHEDDSEDEAEDDVQQPQKGGEGHATPTTARPLEAEIASDHIPGHVGPHEHEDEKQEIELNVTPAGDAAPSTARPETTEAAETDADGAEPHRKDPVASDAGGTTPPATDDKEHDAQPDDRDEDRTTPEPVRGYDERVEQVTPVQPSVDDASLPTEAGESSTPIATTSRPTLAPSQTADEQDNRIDDHHDEEQQQQVEHEKIEQDEQEERTTVAAKDDGQPSATTSMPAERDEQPGEISETPAQTPAAPAAEESTTAATDRKEQEPVAVAQPEHPPQQEVTAEKKEPAHKADDVPQAPPEQDFVELPPAVVVTELPAVPLSTEEPATTEQAREPPKDEILPNMPLEADSHVLDETTTTEHTAAFGDRKEDDGEQGPPQHPLLTDDDFNEPVEMNTVIPLEMDEQKPQPGAGDESLSEQQHEVEQEPVPHGPQETEGDDHDDDDDEDDDDSVDEQHEHHHAPTAAHDEVHSEEEGQDEDNDTDVGEVVDQLFPESIPGEGDCLIDGVTYGNGASVPPTSKCQVACRCSNSIVHCEVVNCDPAPSAECSAKSTQPGECCPAYSCPPVTSTTEAADDSKDADSSKDHESDELSGSHTTEVGVSASSGSSTESSDASSEAPSTTAPLDFQSSAEQGEADESGKPSEAESDSASWDLDDDVFKPLQPQQPLFDPMHINFFAGNRPTTAQYDDEIVLSTVAPATSKPATQTPVESLAEQTHGHDPHTTQSAGEQDADSDFSTPASAFAERKPEVLAEDDESQRESESESEKERDGGVPQTTGKEFADEEGTTAAAELAVQHASTSPSLEEEPRKPEPTTTAAMEEDEQGERVTTPRAFAPAAEEPQEASTPAAIAEDEEGEKPDVHATTLKPSSDELVEEQKQDSPAPTTVRSVDQTVEEVTQQEEKPKDDEHRESELVSTTLRTDERLPGDDDEDKAVDGVHPEATTVRLADAESTPEAVTEQEEPDVPVTAYDDKRKQDVTTTGPTVEESVHVEGDQEPSRTTVGSALATDEESTQKTHAAEVDDIPTGISEPATSPKEELDEVRVTTASELEPLVPSSSAAPALDAEVSEDGQAQESDEVVPTTVGPVKEPAAVTEGAHESTTQQVPAASTTVGPPKTAEADDSIVFRLEDDEDSGKPVVKPAPDSTKPPKAADESDEDNLISPVEGAEQDGGFHFPQHSDDDDEDEDEDELPIVKPTLPDGTVPGAAPPEADDQIKEHPEHVQSTSGSDLTTEHDEEVRPTSAPSTLRPAVAATSVAPQAEPEVSSEQQPDKHHDESNEIDADLPDDVSAGPAKPAKPATESDEQETPLVYDDIEETEQHTSAAPAGTTQRPTPTDAGDLEHEEPKTTQSPQDDRTEQSTPAVHPQHDDLEHDDDDENVTGPSSPVSSVDPTVTSTEQADVKEPDQAEQKPAQPEADDTPQTTVRSQEAGGVPDSEQGTTPVSVPLAEEHDEQQSVHDEHEQPDEVGQDKEVSTTAEPTKSEQGDDVAQDKEAATTETSLKAEQDDGKQPTGPFPAADDLEQDTTTQRAADIASEGEKVDGAGGEEQTPAPATDRQTTIAPVEDEAMQQPTLDALDDDTQDAGAESDREGQQATSTAASATEQKDPAGTTGVPVAHESEEPSTTVAPDRMTDDKNLGTVPPTVASAADDDVKPDSETPEHDEAAHGDGDDDDELDRKKEQTDRPEADTQHTTAATVSDQQPQEHTSEADATKGEGTTTGPAEFDEVESEQEPGALTTAQPAAVDHREPSTVAPATAAPAAADELATSKPAQEEPDRTTGSPTASEPEKTGAADATEASHDEQPEQQAGSEEESVPTRDDEGGEDDEPAPGTTVRAPVEVAQEPAAAAEEQDAPEHVDSESSTAASPIAAQDPHTTQSYGDGAEAPHAADDKPEAPQPTSTPPPTVSDEIHTDEIVHGDEETGATSEQPTPAVEKVEQPAVGEDTPASTAAPTVPVPEHTDDEHTDDEKDQQQHLTPAVSEDDEREEEKLKEPATTSAPAVYEEKEPADSEEDDGAEVPQTDDLNADDDSSEESVEPVVPVLLPTTVPPAKGEAPAEEGSTPGAVPEAATFATHAPDSDSQMTEQPTTAVQREQAPVTASPGAGPSTTAADDGSTERPTEEAPHAEATTAGAVDQHHSQSPDAEQEPAVTGSSSVTTVTPTTHAPTTGEADAEMTTLAAAPVTQKPVPAQEQASSTGAPPSMLDERFDEEAPPQAPAQQPAAKPADDELQKPPPPPQEASAESDDETQTPVKPAFPEDATDEDADADADQQKVQEPSVSTDVGEAAAKPDEPSPAQPETVGPSYGAPGQHYDSGYGHMPPHYPPSSYEDDYGEEEDPAAFGPGTCRYGGKLYVSAQQIPRDDPCDFCFCFRSDIICLQQSCPPPISGCNEEPISGFCCPRYECPVSMATVLNVTTSTTTTTTTLPPHFPPHAYKGAVQKRGCQIQGKPYNVGEMVASASGPCMRCTCGGDGQMQCEPKACSPEPMLQQMIAVAAARRR